MNSVRMQRPLAVMMRSVDQVIAPDASACDAARQMRELPYYNSFFKSAHPPAIELARVLAEEGQILKPGDPLAVIAEPASATARANALVMAHMAPWPRLGVMAWAASPISSSPG